MKIPLALAVSLLLSGPGALRAATLELTGTACLFGDKLALLVLYPAPPAAPVNFTLSEGQAQYGIQLMRVDTANRQVEIEQDGVKKIISMCGSPILPENTLGPGMTNGAGAALDPQILAAYLNDDEEVKRIKAGNPAVNFSGGGAQAGSDQNSGGTGGTATGAGQPADSTADHSKEMWYQESLTIEQRRIATAQDVLAGDATPWPRTPLTPVNTPAPLIGPETYFPNHIPGYVVHGSVNALAAQ
jgi:hypothetical protein